MSYFTMPTVSEVEEARNNLDILIGDGDYIATVVSIREGKTKEGLPYYLQDWMIEIEGKPTVTDYISIENPKTGSFSQLRLGEMALAMLKLQPGEKYNIKDFIYKSACITIKNKKDKQGYLKPRIVRVLKVTDINIEVNKNDILHKSGIALPQKTTEFNGEIVGDEIPY